MAFSGLGKKKGATRSSISSAMGSSFESALSAALRLPRLGRLVAEAVDEGHHVLALVLLLLLELTVRACFSRRWRSKLS